MQTRSIFDAHGASELPPADAIPGVPSPLAEALAVVGGHFERAATSGPDTIPHAICGLRALLRLGDLRSTEAPPREIVEHLATSIQMAVPHIAAACGNAVPLEALGMGTAAAVSFLGVFTMSPAQAEERIDPNEMADRLDHVAILRNALDTIVRHQRIEARGDLMRRTIRINRALAADGAGASIQ